MAARHFTYTVPSSIEGEPEQVAKLAVQQVNALAAVVAELSADTFVQLRAAGIDPDDEEAVAKWLDTPEGRAASDLVWAAQVFNEVTKAL
jgi:hypothetical protein